MTITPQALAAAAQALHMPCICDSDASHEEQVAWATQTAQAVLEAAMPHLEGGWDAARDRATEANEARRDQIERDAQLAAAHATHPRDCRTCRRQQQDWLPLDALLRRQP